MKHQIKKIFDRHAENIGENYFYRSLTAIFLFDFLDRLRIAHFPPDWLHRLDKELSSLSNFYSFCDNSFELSQNDFCSWRENNTLADFETKTGETYYKLWKDFKKEEYFAQAKNYLEERMEKNGISLNGIKMTLDAGCGGGRYALALKSLGCEKVTGIDISPNSIRLAKQMSPYADEVNFVEGSVLELPFQDNTFDFVFSNGVLHHAFDTEKGLKEIYRVLKKGGRSWLYLYGGKNSFFWDMVNYCRRLLFNIPQNYIQSLMKTLGYPPGRIFHRCDFFFVPEHRRYLQSEVETMLKDAGFNNFKRLERGVYFDWDEIIHDNPHIDPYIYGEGEMRFLIQK